MITTDGLIEVQEQEGGTYIFPTDNKFEPSWAIYVFKDGTAHLYMKRKATGELLGKPVILKRGKIRSIKKQVGDALVEDFKLTIGEVFQIGKDNDPEKFFARYEGYEVKDNKAYDILKPLDA